MKPDKYQQAQDDLVLIANIVKEIPLEDMLEDARKAESIGPVLDPTLWIKAGKQLAEVIKLAEAALIFKREALRQIEQSKQN